LYKELVTAPEGVIPSEHGKIIILKSQKVDMELLKTGLIRLKQRAEKHSQEKLRALLQEIVPEYNNV